MSKSEKPGAFAPITGKPVARPALKKDDWQVVMPVPGNAPEQPAKLYSGERPSHKWCYRDAAGEQIGWIYRFEKKDSKDFRPLVFCHNQKTGKSEWRWKSWPDPRPLYGLDRLANDTSTTVLIVEGEKCADVGTDLLPDMVAITSPGGSKAAVKADWSPLAGRKVIIWPDNDEPGFAYAKKVAALVLDAGATSVAIIIPPEDKPTGWDITDAIKDGWTADQVKELINQAKVCSISAQNSPSDIGVADVDDEGDKSKKKRVPKSQNALKLLDDCEFWRDSRNIAYATFNFRDRIEHAKVRDNLFRIYFADLYYRSTGGSLSSQAEEEVLRTITARAIAHGELCIPYRRVAYEGENIIVDLANDEGQLVRITGAGWEIITSASIKFLRSDTASALLLPVQDYEEISSIRLLRKYCNLDSDSDFILTIAWVMGAFRPKGPYPILAINGEMGSGKSFFSDMIASLVDPSKVKRISVPKDERDLIIAANYQRTLLFDNISAISRNLSDSLCKLATGGGLVARKLHSDDELISLNAENPVCINGIPDLARQSDMADRSIPIQLNEISETDRLPEEEIYKNLQIDLPKILGALFTGLSAGVRNWNSTKLKGSPRMADFARWAEACSSGLGWHEGDFMVAYKENRNAAFAISFESDAVAPKIKEWLDMNNPEGWEGSASTILANLNSFASENERKVPGWPKSPSAMGTALVRIAPLMRKRGYTIKKGHLGSNRSISIQPMV